MSTPHEEVTAPVRLQHSRHGAVAEIVLASPATRNALSRVFLEALSSALDTVLGQVHAQVVRAVVLRHEPPVFCAGLDLKERVADHQSLSGRAGGATSSGRAMAHVIGQIMSMPVPTIAAVTGAARAGGIGLMAACDLPVVRRGVDFSFSEVRIGVAPSIISVPVLARCAWSSVAAAFLTGEVFDADEALRIGLVTHVVDDVDATVGTLCDGVLAGAPGAVASTKRMLRDRTADVQTLAEMARQSDELFRTAEAAEGMAAFLDKRRPSWQPGG